MKGIWRIGAKSIRRREHIGYKEFGRSALPERAAGAMGRPKAMLQRQGDSHTGNSEPNREHSKAIYVGRIYVAETPTQVVPHGPKKEASSPDSQTDSAEKKPKKKDTQQIPVFYSS